MKRIRFLSLGLALLLLGGCAAAGGRPALTPPPAGARAHILRFRATDSIALAMVSADAPKTSAASASWSFSRRAHRRERLMSCILTIPSPLSNHSLFIANYLGNNITQLPLFVKLFGIYFLKNLDCQDF